MLEAKNKHLEEQMKPDVLWNSLIQVCQYGLYKLKYSWQKFVLHISVKIETVKNSLLEIFWPCGRNIIFIKNFVIKGKRLINPKGNRWSPSNPNIEISPNGLMADDKTRHRDYLQHVYAIKEFSLSVALCREDNFPGGVFFYYEVTQNTFMSYEL
jgi:hypothetical protein